MSTLNKSLRETLVDCLTQQLSEYELLKSMYPNKGEIILTNKTILQDIRNFLDENNEYTPGHLDYIVNLSSSSLKLEVCANLPSFYPQEEPNINVRCNQLNRQEESIMNTELSNYIKKHHLGEVCLFTAISWLQENVESFKITKYEHKSNETCNANKKDDKENFTRLWIFSHHIYNKKKREDIESKAKNLNLKGFCLPGKPGIICVEGSENDCKEWWKTIKCMNWKKIVIRKTETFNSSEWSNAQKFNHFTELSFKNSGRHSKHADMSEFSKYMDEHGLMQIFNDLFGLYSAVL